MERITKYFWFGLIIFIVVLTGLAGCSKKKVWPTYTIPQDLKDCLVFNTGSYWVYHYENNGDPDSTYVTVNPIITYSGEGYPGERSALERNKISYNASLIDSIIVLQDTYLVYFGNGAIFAGSESSTFTPGYISVTGSRDTLRNIAFLDSATINGNVFHNIYVSQYSTPTLQYFPDVCTAYFVKNVGLVKFNHRNSTTNETWSLMRYKVVQ